MPFRNFGLDANILKAVQAAGYTEPTPVQSAAIPLILAGHDLIGIAQTGTGKTAAFVLPILAKLAPMSRDGGPRRIRALASGVDLGVATPGRLLDLMGRRFCDFSSLNFLVLDEAERMLDMGFLPDIRRIVRALPQKRQTLLFSATLSSEIEAVTHEFLRSPKTLQIGRRANPAD